VLPDLDGMLAEYYRLRDWTPEGAPSNERLEALGLGPGLDLD
jgi:aldehyde:ferredoxin oxidoreductase